MRTILSALLLCAGMAQAQLYIYSLFDPPSGATYMTVTGMNNAGQILVAWADASQGRHSAIRSASGTYMPIELPGTIWTWATALNNNGQIAGVYGDATGTHSFGGAADGKSYTSFDVPDTGAAQYGTPTGINDQGEIVGAGFSGALVTKGFLRSADGSTYTTISSGNQTNIGGINNDGDIVGWSVFNGSYGVRHGFLRNRDGNFRVVEVPGVLDGSHLVGINNRGQIISSSFVLNPDGTSVALDVAVARNPSAIDDNGRVAGTNYSGDRGFLAVPSISGSQPAIRSLLGVESASGFGGLSAIAPGSWIEIYGVNLASGTRQWCASDFSGNTAPMSLDGVKVTINGSSAFVSYISPGQVNAQAPSTLTPGPATVTVTNGSQTSSPYSTVIAATEPGLLSTPANEFSDHITIFLPNGSIAGTVKPGDTIVLYGIGFGSTTPEVAAGQIASQPDQLQGRFEVLFDAGAQGSQFGQVTYAGHAPGTVGLYQFNVLVPNQGSQPYEVTVRCGFNGDLLPSPYLAGGLYVVP